MDNVKTLDLVRPVGAPFFISHPDLFGSNILHITRNGIGMVQLSSGILSASREFIFRKTGLLAYKVLFFDSPTAAENIHIIYKT